MRKTYDQDAAAADAASLRYGVVASVDLAAGRIVVECGDIRTAPIRWLERRAGATRTRSVPSVGEQVLLLCPGGDIEAAIALVGVTSDANPLPGAGATEFVEFPDGAVLSYDPKTHALTAKLPAGATVAIAATGGVTLDVGDRGLTIRGPVSIDGKVTVAGDLDATGTLTGKADVVGGGKSLKTHKHLGVTAGGGVSGAPQ